jgi:hypothetical protein
MVRCMSPSIRRHLNYANLVATLALLFAMSGGALAATHYLVNSTKQINPRVLAALKGQAGSRGPAGPGGPAGPAGVAGAVGPQGPKGTEGMEGARGPKGDRGGEGAEGPAGVSALSPLPSGVSESGDYGTRTPNDGMKGPLEQTVTFPIPLPEEIPPSKIVYNVQSTSAHCGGPGHADRGYLCIYSESRGSVEGPLTVTNLEGSTEEGTGIFGFVMSLAVSGGEAYDLGTYTVTAS